MWYVVLVLFLNFELVILVFICDVFAISKNLSGAKKAQILVLKEKKFLTKDVVEKTGIGKILLMIGLKEKKQP